MNAYPTLRVAYGKSLVAAVDAGVVVVPGSPDRIYTVVDAWMRSTGTADTCTSVDVTDGTTVAASFEVAGLTNGAILRAGAANTVATYLGTALAADTAISVLTVGSGIGTATAIEYVVLYSVTSVT